MDKRSFDKRLADLEQQAGQHVWAAYYPGLDYRPPDAPPAGYVRLCGRSGQIMPLEEFQRRYPRGTVVHIHYVKNWRGEAEEE